MVGRPTVYEAEQADVDQSSVLIRCPASSGTDLCTTWYRHPDVEDFWICSKCFQDKLRSTQFASCFAPFTHDVLPGRRASCESDSPHFEKLLAQANSAGSLERLISFMRDRSTSVSCAGMSGIHGGQGVVWYCIPQVKSFIVCEACYKDVVLATNFASRFELYTKEQSATDLWSCDIAIPYLRRMLLLMAAHDDWNGFAVTANFRLSLPACTSAAVSSTSRVWFRVVHPSPLPTYVICESCFQDVAAFTTIAQNFVEYQLSSLEMQQRFVCDYSTRHTKTCTDVLLGPRTDAVRNFARWHTLIKEIMPLSVCDSTAGQVSEWFTIVNPNTDSPINDDFDICKACYLTYAVAPGFASAFRPLNYPPGTRRVCDFSTANIGSSRYLQAWHRSLMIGSPSPLITFASLMSGIQPCSRDAKVKSQTWHILSESCYFCPACYRQIARNTFFAATISPPQHRDSAVCDMYTDNMRQRYLLACRAEDLTEFTAYCDERAQYYQLYVKNANFQHTMSKLGQTRDLHNLSMAMQATSLAAQYQGIGSTQWTYANSNVMWAHTNQINNTRMRMAGTPTGRSIVAEWKLRE